MNNDLNKRIWEIDFIRGVCIILVLVAHFFSKYNYFVGGGGYSTEWLNYPFLVKFANVTKVMNKQIIYPIGIFVIITLLIISGISTWLSKNNLKGAIVALILAYSLTLYTYIIYKITGYNGIIRFGILHLIAWMKLFGALIKLKPQLFTLLGLIIVMLISIIIYKFPFFVDIDFIFIGLGNSNAIINYGGEYFPIYRYGIYFMIGIVIGVYIYRKKKGLIKNIEIVKVTKPINYIGKRSIIFYMLHFIIYDIFFYTLGFILGV